MIRFRSKSQFRFVCSCLKSIRFSFTLYAAVIGFLSGGALLVSMLRAPIQTWCPVNAYEPLVFVFGASLGGFLLGWLALEISNLAVGRVVGGKISR